MKRRALLFERLNAPTASPHELLLSMSTVRTCLIKQLTIMPGQSFVEVKRSHSRRLTHIRSCGHAASAARGAPPANAPKIAPPLLPAVLRRPHVNLGEKLSTRWIVLSFFFSVMPLLRRYQASPDRDRWGLILRLEIIWYDDVQIRYVAGRRFTWLVHRMCQSMLGCETYW